MSVNFQDEIGCGFGEKSSQVLMENYPKMKNLRFLNLKSNIENNIENYIGFSEISILSSNLSILTNLEILNLEGKVIYYNRKQP